MVWLLWRRIGSANGWYLVGVYANQAVVTAAKEKERKFIEEYHGPYYPVEWEGLNPIKTQHGDAIKWEPRVIKT